MCPGVGDLGWLRRTLGRGDALGRERSASPRLFRQEIDTYIIQARERSYETVVRFGKRGLNMAATAAIQAATKVPGRGQDPPLP